MNLKNLSKKGFTLIELVMVVGISLILFSLLGNTVGHFVSATQKNSVDEEIANELYFFENYIRDEIESAQKIVADEQYGFKIVNRKRVENKGNEYVQDTVYFDLEKNEIRRNRGSNALISRVEKFDIKCTEDYVLINVKMLNGKSKEILVAIRNRE
ncbi:prepilin-type N-terminal cleavage/methylation domain-containing protein [Peptoniphilus asaccharolyticus DSM 20463]|uniref:Prepilin-type N-terminal cleavage/methylation domain-containing protein n=1 Tax=Peptoniphilus asaccharolyticus DSM 20463 TaxID=573058 RepID=A0A1W1UN12_PEPAS|nr:type II secretion system protein [Peptoniphilus asaccharolyticus]MBL7574933.1 type II secretion system protein [Peptoniphilus asaccharolyticus]SMB82379.1 prepilin-type N-terminal cleavage/methylation domain-containing protein [Peptoniphilus asaccharolyticus DSM 20463]